MNVNISPLREYEETNVISEIDNLKGVKNETRRGVKSFKNDNLMSVNMTPLRGSIKKRNA